MRNLLEIKEWLKRFYSKFDVYIQPVLKFLLAFITLNSVNGQLGYMARVDSVAIVLIVALLCSFLPFGFMIFFAALFVLLHFYALGLEVVLVGFCLFLVMFLLFFRFSPKDSLVVLLVPVFFTLRIPYVVPLAMGLVGTPASAVSIACGVVVYHLIHFVSLNAPTISAMDAGETSARLKVVIDGILNNREMLITIIAFAFTVVLVYTIRRLSTDYSWSIASISGAILNVAIMLIGDLMYDTNVSVLWLIFGSIISLGLVAVLQFFVFSVDYSRTEKVQFEDDEYYYYVKAVPKITLAEPKKTVKKINTQVARTAHPGSVHQPARNGGTQRPVTRQAASRTITNQREDMGRTFEGGYTDIEDITEDFDEN